MDAKTVKSISNQVYRQFPEMHGVQPKKRLQSGTGKANPTYTLTFQTTVRTQDGRQLDRWVRVVANEQGSIIKMTTSH